MWVSLAGAEHPRVVAAATTIVLVVAVCLILSRGQKKDLVNGEKASLLKRMLIDKSTSTYSLSKLQLYIWLFVSVASYIYLLIAKILVQHILDFPTPSDSIWKIAGISIATTVAATAVTSASGGKGSGPFEPSASDLISSGGDVASERVQQLLWTLFAAPAFLVLAYMVDPKEPNTLPKLPEELLALMGLSAAGYVGGKLARGAGPKVSSLVASVVSGPPPFLTLTVCGSDIQTKGAIYTLADTAVTGAPAIPLPQDLQAGSVIDSAGVATKLELLVPAAGLRLPAAGAKWDYTFTIVAADGEKAEWKF